jgi:predicted ribosome quality control (RQC) complex YloA/Tae2 family protein
MKTKLSLIDVLAEVAELRRKLVGMRCSNIYDVDGDKTFLIKLAGSDTDKDHKEVLLIESGVRLHTTQYARDKPTHVSVIHVFRQQQLAQ